MAQPYRVAASLPRPRVSFGDPRRGVWSILAGLALVALSAAIVFAWTRLGGRINGSVLLPALLGLLLVFRTQWGTLEFARDEELLLVRRRGAWPRPTRDIPVRDVQTVEIVPASFRDKEPDYHLNLVLDGGQRLRLGGAGSEAALERDRAAIADFLREHHLLWGAAGRPAPLAAPAEELVEALAQDADERARRA